MNIKKEDLQALSEKLNSSKDYLKKWINNASNNTINHDLDRSVNDFQQYFESKEISNEPVSENEFGEKLQILIDGIISASNKKIDPDYNEEFPIEIRTATIDFAAYFMHDLSKWCEEKEYNNLYGNAISKGMEKLAEIKEANPTFQNKKDKFIDDILVNINNIKAIADKDESYKNAAEDISENINNLIDELRNTQKSKQIPKKTFIDMSKIIIKIAGDTPTIKGVNVDPLIEQLYELNNKLDAFYSTDASKDCTQKIWHLVDVAESNARNGIDAHPWDYNDNSRRISTIDNIILFMRKENFDEHDIESHVKNSSEDKIHLERLQGHIKETGSKDDLLLTDDNIDALSGTGSIEYTRLSNALKKYKAGCSPEDIRNLFDTARDYLKCKKTTPTFPGGKARVEAAARVMAVAGIRLAEMVQDNRLKPESHYDYLYSLSEDMMVECARNKTFREIVMNQCPHVIEAGANQMFDVMNYAVSCEKISNGKNAVYEGIIAEAKEVNGSFTLNETDNYRVIHENVNNFDRILNNRLLELGVEKSESRLKVDELKVTINKLNAMKIRQTAPNKVKQQEVPQAGMR